MHVSASLAMFGSAVFALVCLGVAATGYLSLDGITDAQQLSDAKGFAGFWMFLAFVGIAFGLLSWRIMRTEALEDTPEAKQIGRAHV